MFPRYGPSGLAGGSPQSLPKGYRALSTLGKGSFGIVQKAERSQDNAVVAVKCLWRQYTSWQECLQLREVKALQRLRHANIVTLYEMLREDNVLYFIFEFCPSTLHDALKSCHTAGRALPEAQIHKTIQQVLAGVAYMHRKGFFHRDLKPDNLLLSAAGDIKIGDFGLAREMRSAPPYTAQCGTLWYRAPETLLPGIPYSAPIDLWAAGVIFAELYLPQPLFPAQTDIDQFYRHCQFLGTPTIEAWAQGVQVATTSNLRLPQCRGVSLRHKLPLAPPAVVGLVGRLITWNPNQRYTADQALKFVAQNFPALPERPKRGGREGLAPDPAAAAVDSTASATSPHHHLTDEPNSDEVPQAVVRHTADDNPDSNPSVSQGGAGSSSGGSSASVGQLLDEIDAQSGHGTEASATSQSSRLSPKAGPPSTEHSPRHPGAVAIVDQLLADDLKELSTSAPDMGQLLTRGLSTSRGTTASGREESVNPGSFGSSICLWDQQANSLRGSLAEYRFGTVLGLAEVSPSLEGDSGSVGEEDGRRRRAPRDRPPPAPPRSSDGSVPEAAEGRGWGRREKRRAKAAESTQVEILSPRKAAEMITSDADTASDSSPFNSMRDIAVAPQPPNLYGNPGQSECFRRVSDNHRRNSIVDCVIKAADHRTSCDDDGLRLTDVTATNADLFSNASQSPQRPPKTTSLAELTAADIAAENSFGEVPKPAISCTSCSCSASVQIQAQLGDMKAYLVELQTQMAAMQGMVGQLCSEVRALTAVNQTLQQQVSLLQPANPFVGPSADDEATLRQDLGNVTSRMEALEGQLASFVKHTSKAPSPGPGVSPTVLWANGQSQLLVNAPKLDISLRRMRRGQARESPYASRRPSNRSITTDSGSGILTPSRPENQSDGEAKLSPAVPTTIFVAACRASATSEASSAPCSPSRDSGATPIRPTSPTATPLTAIHVERATEDEATRTLPSPMDPPAGLVTPQTPAQPPSGTPLTEASNASSPVATPGLPDAAAEDEDDQPPAEPAGDGGPAGPGEGEGEGEGEGAEGGAEGWQAAQEAWLRKELAPRRPSFSDGRYNLLLRTSPHRPPLLTRSPPPPFPPLSQPLTPDPQSPADALATSPMAPDGPPDPPHPSPATSPTALKPLPRPRYTNPVLAPLHLHRQPPACPTPPLAPAPTPPSPPRPPPPPAPTVPEPTALVSSLSSSAPPHPEVEEETPAEPADGMAETWPRAARLHGRRALSCVGDFVPAHLRVDSPAPGERSPSISPKVPQAPTTEMDPTTGKVSHHRLRRFSGILM